MKSDIIEAATGKFIEPKHAGLIYSRMDLVRALNHYSNFAKPDSLKDWSMTYLRKAHPELVTLVNKAPAAIFSTYGALCRMTGRGFDLDETLRERIHLYFKLIADDMKLEKSKPVVETEIVKPVKPKFSRSREAFELAVDETLTDGKIVMPSMIMSESHKDIIEICQRVLKEIQEAPEYYEGTAALQKKFFTLVLDKVQKVQSIKRASTPSVVKNPGKQVEGVKFLRKVEYKFLLETLQVRGLEPVETLERKKMYIFDAKYRRLIVFVAMSAAGFQYSGTTLKNVDLKKSFSKTIRKPEEFFKYTKISITELNKAFADINSKETSMLSSRFNSDWLILKVTEKGA